MTAATTVAALSAPLPAPPPQWEASLGTLAANTLDLGTLHDVNVAKLQVLVSVRDQIAAIVADIGETKTVALTPDTITALSDAMSKLITADFEKRFVDLQQTVGNKLDAGLSKAEAEIQTLRANQVRSDEWGFAFRDEISPRVRMLAEDIRRLRLQTGFAVAESEAMNEELMERQDVVETEVAELAAQSNKVRSRRRGAAGRNARK
jgi:hypothetical protein